MDDVVTTTDNAQERRLARVGRDSLPLRIPGDSARNVPRRTLSLMAFNAGWHVMGQFYLMPKGEAKDTFYKAIQGVLDDDEFARAVQWATSELRRRPTPNELLEAGRPRGSPGQPATRGSAWAGHWIFRCEGCGYTYVSRRPADEAPSYCSGANCSSVREPEPEMAW